MNWLQKIANTVIDYPVAGPVVSGLRVIDQIDNMSSIGASFYQYEILPDVREIPMSDFGSAKPIDNFYTRTDIEGCRELANEIKMSGEIMPLIVAIDSKGPYILEGGHRFVALHLLGALSLPALVVIDKDREDV